MVRARWPDAVIVLALLALAAIGVWALWGDRVVTLWRPSLPAQQAPGAAQFDRTVL